MRLLLRQLVNSRHLGRQPARLESVPRHKLECQLNPSHLTTQSVSWKDQVDNRKQLAAFWDKGRLPVTTPCKRPHSKDWKTIWPGARNWRGTLIISGLLGNLRLLNRKAPLSKEPFKEHHRSLSRSLKPRFVLIARLSSLMKPRYKEGLQGVGFTSLILVAE